MIQTIKLDCVILDIDLPDEDGFDVCSRVRTFTSLPIIFLSNYTEEESRIRGLVIGGPESTSATATALRKSFNSTA